MYKLKNTWLDDLMHQNHNLESRCLFSMRLRSRFTEIVKPNGGQFEIHQAR